jgi:hypothetical protein
MFFFFNKVGEQEGGTGFAQRLGRDVCGEMGEVAPLILK